MKQTVKTSRAAGQLAGAARNQDAGSPHGSSQ